MRDDEQHTDQLSSVVGQVRETMHELAETAATAPQQAEKQAEKIGRKWFVRSVLACTAVTLLVAITCSVAALTIGLENRADLTTQDAEIDALRTAAEAAKPAGDAANRKLEARGQEPVPIPEPGEGDDTDVLVSAVAAQVLAQIPNPRPTPAELGSSIAAVLRDNPTLIEVPVSSVSAALAGYLATNPPPSGPQGPSGAPGGDGPQGERGEKGDKGDPPTTADIQAAFVAFIDANPDFLPSALCRTTGPWTRVELRTADGGSVTGYLCVVSNSTPGPPTGTEPAPLLPLPNLGGS